MARPGTSLLHPELIHAPEHRRVLRLERVPPVEVGRGRVLGKSLAVARDDGAVDYETEEVQVVRGEESLDLWQHVPMLLDVEEEVAALARAEEVLILRHMRQQGVACGEDILAAAPDLLRRAAIVACGDESARRDHCVYCKLKSGRND